MRYKNNKYQPYQRPFESKSRNPESKAFIIYEGAQTEKAYLNALIKSFESPWLFVLVDKTGKEKEYTRLKEISGLAERIQTEQNANNCTYHLTYKNIARKFSINSIVTLQEQQILKVLISIHKKNFPDISLNSEIQKEK